MVYVEANGVKRIECYGVEVVIRNAEGWGKRVEVKVNSTPTGWRDWRPTKRDGIVWKRGRVAFVVKLASFLNRYLDKPDWIEFHGERMGGTLAVGLAQVMSGRAARVEARVGKCPKPWWGGGRR